jgi:hypothetical protein
MTGFDRIETATLFTGLYLYKVLSYRAVRLWTQVNGSKQKLNNKELFNVPTLTFGLGVV